MARSRSPGEGGQRPPLRRGTRFRAPEPRGAMPISPRHTAWLRGHAGRRPKGRPAFAPERAPGPRLLSGLQAVLHMLLAGADRPRSFWCGSLDWLLLLSSMKEMRMTMFTCVEQGTEQLGACMHRLKLMTVASGCRLLEAAARRSAARNGR